METKRRILGTVLGAGLLLTSLAWATPARADDTAMVPLRGAAQSLGWHVSYDAAARRVDLTKSGAQAAVWLDSRTGFRNARRYNLSVPVQSWDGSSYISQGDLDRLLAVTRTRSSDAIRGQIAAAATQYQGIPYVWGGTNPQGFDCSGFVWYLYHAHGVALPRTNSGGMFAMGTPVTRANLQPGDLVFFAINQPGVISHVGIYLGGDQFISATTAYGIYVTSLSKPYWVNTYMGARRL